MASVTTPTPTLGRPAGTTALVSQARNIVLNVFRYFDNKDKTVLIQEIVRRTSEATNVSQSVINKIRLQGKRSGDGVIRSPLHRNRRATVLGRIDDFDKAAIRREILAFYERGELPTLDLLLRRLREPPVDFRGGSTSLRKLLKSMGFRYKKHCSSSRAILMERPDNVAARDRFLRELKTNRSSECPRPEIYLDETRIDEDASVEQRRTDKEGTVRRDATIGRGGTFVLVHAGSSEGFVPGALLMFKSQTGNKGDYHDSMNSHTFKTWFLEQLMPNIPPRSLIIMDNAPYHNAQLNRAPAGNSRKDVVEWLSDNGVPHDPSHTTPELYRLVQLHKRAKLRYEIDELAAAAGHEVLRLPPYYCGFNPIELVWAQIKQEVKEGSSNDGRLRVEELTLKAVDNVTADDWKRCVERSKAIQEDYHKKDVAFERMFESFSSELSHSSSSSSDGSDEDEH